MIIKFCGITNVNDALNCLDAGANLIGINLVAGPRMVDPPRAISIIQQIPEARTVVVLIRCDAAWSIGLPTGQPPSWLQELRTLGVRLLQVYGEPSPQACRALADLGFDLIEVCHLPPRGLQDASMAQELDNPVPGGATDAARPRYVLLDTKVKGKLGGSGVSSDWKHAARMRALLQSQLGVPVLLAGGLSVDNVAEAINQVRPDGVDVSSGVESAPGVKDHVRVAAFIREARKAVQNLNSPSS